MAYKLKSDVGVHTDAPDALWHQSLELAVQPAQLLGTTPMMSDDFRPLGHNAAAGLYNHVDCKLRGQRQRCSNVQRDLIQACGVCNMLALGQPSLNHSWDRATFKVGPSLRRACCEEGGSAIRPPSCQVATNPEQHAQDCAYRR